MPNTNSAITIMGWMNSAAFASSSTIASILGAYNGSNDASIAPTTAIQLGAGQAGVANSMDVWTWGGTVLVSTGGSPGVSSTGWFHAAYTCTAISGGSQTHSIYINGALAATATNSLQVAGVLTQVFFNGYPETNTLLSSYQESSNSLLDDARMYNRILTLPEIQTIYTSRGFRDGIVYGLISRYAFNETSVGNVMSGCIDHSINKNNLTTVNVNGSTLMPTVGISIAETDTRRVLKIN
jgi:hypothetical protein